MPGLQKMETVVAEPQDLVGLSDRQVIALYGQVMGELMRRGVVHSGNNPIADMAERIVADYYGVDPAPPNEKSYDVQTRDGTRIQVKALRKTRPGNTGLSPLRTLDFDLVAIVIFELDMQLREVFLVSLDAVKDHVRWSKAWSSHRLTATKRLLADKRVTRLSPEEVLAGHREHL